MNIHIRFFKFLELLQMVVMFNAPLATEFHLNGHGWDAYFILVILNRWRRGLWIVFQFSWKQRKTSGMEPCDTPVFLDVSPEKPRTRQLTNNFKNYTPDIDWYDCHCTLKFKFPTMTALGWMWLAQIHYIAFGAVGEICTLGEKELRQRTKWRWTMKYYQGVARGHVYIVYIVRKLRLKLTQFFTGRKAKRDPL